MTRQHGRAQLVAIDDGYLCMDCLTMYVAPWGLAGIAVPVTFISVAVWFFNIGIARANFECSTAIWGIMWWYGRKSMPISEWIMYWG